MLTDSQLMDAYIRKKDISAFNEIIYRYKNLIWKIAFRFTANEDDSKDIVQNTFIRLLGASNRYRPSASLSTYIYYIVTNLCLDFKKKKKTESISNADEIIDEKVENDDYDILDKEKINSQLTAAVSSLPPRQKLAIIYKYDHDLPVREIAEIMKTSEKSVERLLYHGRDSLRKSLNHLKNV